MKFKTTGQIPEEGQVIQDAPLNIGTVYRSKGNTEKGAAYWVIIGKNDEKGLTMLAGVSKQLEVISVAAYANDKVRGMERIGMCMEVAQFKGNFSCGV